MSVSFNNYILHGRIKRATFQIEKSVPMCEGNGVKVILYKKSAPACGGSVGKADEGGNNSEGLSYIQRFEGSHTQTCII